MKTLLTTIFVALFCVMVTNKSYAQENAELKKTEVRVRNLHCDGDMPTIKKQLLKQDGVMDVTFTSRKMEMAVFTIQYHEAAVDQASIFKIIEDTPGCDDKSTKPYKVIKEKAKKEERKK